MLLFCKQPFYKQQQTEIGKKKKKTKGENICSWNIRGTLPRNIPSTFGESSQ